MKTNTEAVKVNANPWGFILDMEGCTYHFGENMSSLTIRPPEGQTLNGGSFKVGLNVGRTIGASFELLGACNSALKYHKMMETKNNGKEFPAQLVKALEDALAKASQ